ncbi:MAG: SulP family inorganic anion transporter [Gammaproteobacteria bacterium]
MKSFFATGLFREILPDLTWIKQVNFRQEFFSGAVGAILVIPQAITFAYLAGLAPEYGFYCAVFVGFFASFFGTSPMVGGPNTAVSILLGLAVLPFAGRGSPLYVDYVLLLSLMVGVIQMVVWLLRGANFFRYFSPAAIAGISMGVGILTITSSLEGIFGLSALTTRFFFEKFYILSVSWRDLVNPYAAVIGGVTILSGLLLKYSWPRSYILLALLTGSLIGVLIEGWFGPIVTQVELLGRLPFQLLPLRWPHFTLEYWLVTIEMLPHAFAIAMLGLAQSMVIVRDLKSHILSDIDPHKEVFAQALANMLSPFFSTFAGSGSFNRTSVALELGASTPLSGIVAATGVMLIAWVLGPLLPYLPMPAIAGILAIVGVGMIKVKEIRRLLRNRIDGSVYLITLFTVLLLGLQTGIVIAVLLSIVFFIIGASKVALVITHHDRRETITVRGNLFYASLDELSRHLRAHPQANTLLDLSRVPYCDTAAREMLEKIRLQRQANGGILEVK